MTKSPEARYRLLDRKIEEADRDMRDLYGAIESLKRIYRRKRDRFSRLMREWEKINP